MGTASNPESTRPAAPDPESESERTAAGGPEQNAAGSRTIAEALAQRESRQLDELETLVARAMEVVAARAAGEGIDVVQSLLAQQLRAHLPVDSKSNKAWLRERAKLIVTAQQR